MSCADPGSDAPLSAEKEAVHLAAKERKERKESSARSGCGTDRPAGEGNQMSEFRSTVCFLSSLRSFAANPSAGSRFRGFWQGGHNI
jgi:hypothetical protein